MLLVTNNYTIANSALFIGMVVEAAKELWAGIPANQQKWLAKFRHRWLIA